MDRKAGVILNVIALVRDNPEGIAFHQIIHFLRCEDENQVRGAIWHLVDKEKIDINQQTGVCKIKNG